MYSATSFFWPAGVCMERQVVQRTKEAFLSGRTRPLEFRLQQLHALQRMITEKGTEISTALKQDINRVSGNAGTAAYNICMLLAIYLSNWRNAGFPTEPI